jgi:hypothetical protein
MGCFWEIINFVKLKWLNSTNRSQSQNIILEQSKTPSRIQIGKMYVLDLALENIY